MLCAWNVQLLSKVLILYRHLINVIFQFFSFLRQIIMWNCDNHYGASRMECQSTAIMVQAECYYHPGRGHYFQVKNLIKVLTLWKQTSNGWTLKNVDLYYLLASCHIDKLSIMIKNVNLLFHFLCSNQGLPTL